MSTDRERQRERLIKLIGDAPRSVNTETAADFLLDNGVTVELPPEPVIAPGTTGWATVRGESRIRVGRIVPLTRDYMAADATWISFITIHGSMLHADDDIDDFVPDPEPLTAEAVDAVVTAAWTDAVNVRERRIRQELAPYVAKGGAA